MKRQCKKCKNIATHLVTTYFIGEEIQKDKVCIEHYPEIVASGLLMGFTIVIEAIYHRPEVGALQSN